MESQPAHVQPTVSRNLVKKAAVLSSIFPGAGQLHLQYVWKGIALALIAVVEYMFLLFYLPKALYGLITLGDAPSHFEVVGKIARLVPGDHSTFMMIEGIISVFVLFLFVVFHVWNVRDAIYQAKKAEAGEPFETFREFAVSLVNRRIVFVLLFFPFILTLFLTVLPLVFSVALAFTNFSAPKHIPPAGLVDWTGFETFLKLFSIDIWSNTFFGVATWTVIWAVFSTLTCYFGGIFLAVLIHQKGIRLKKMWRTIMIIPWAIPNFVSLLIMRNLFNGEFGQVNFFLQELGFDKIPWLSDPFMAKVTVILVNMWVGIPVTMALISGVLTSIPEDLYEAAEVDGASKWHQFWRITMPMILFSTAPILIMHFAGNINNFNLIFLLTDGNPVNAEYQFAGSTDILVTWLYKLTLNQNQYNLASAVGICIFIMIASFSIWNYRRTRAFREEDMIQ